MVGGNFAPPPHSNGMEKLLLELGGGRISFKFQIYTYPFFPLLGSRLWRSLLFSCDLQKYCELGTQILLVSVSEGPESICGLFIFFSFFFWQFR